MQEGFTDFVRRSARVAKKAAVSLLVTTGILVDVFAGFGGGSIASERAHGRPVNVAINHWGSAIEYHTKNHPFPTKHLTADIREVDPIEACEGMPVLHAHFSPDCRHFSSAKGGAPVSDGVRALPWVVVNWAKVKRPTLITMENVKEFLTWGPTTPVEKDGETQYFPNGEMKRMPDPARKGETFKEWVGKFRDLGYEVDWRILDAADYGAPTHRRRLFLVARCDGKSVAWPEPTHGPLEKCNARTRTTGHLGIETASGSLVGNEVSTSDSNGEQISPSLFDPQFSTQSTAGSRAGNKGHRNSRANSLKPYRTAAECIDFSRPCPSIFMNREEARTFGKETGIRVVRPLAKKTRWRIAKGVVTFVINSAKPFIVQTGYGERVGQGPRINSVDEPLGTVVGTGKRAIIAPAAAKYYGQGFGQDITQPLHTIPTHDRFGLIASNLVCANHGGDDARLTNIERPLNTITGKHGNGLVASHIVKFRFDSIGTAANAPLPTITAGQGSVRDAGAAHALGISSAILVEVQNAGNPLGSRDVARPAPTIMANPKGGGWAMVAMVPFVAGVGGRAGQSLPTAGDAPLGTITAKNDRAMVATHMTRMRFADSQVGKPVDDPLQTICAGGNHFALTASEIIRVNPPSQDLAAAFLAKLRGSGGWKPCDLPLDTICVGATTFGHVSAFITKFYGTATADDILKPLATVTANAGGGHMGAVHAFLAQGVSEAALAGFWRVYAFLVEQLGPDAPLPMLRVNGSLYLIVDLGLRMLEPRELLNAQFTPEIAADYILPKNKSLAVKLIGNSVSPPVLEAVIRAQKVRRLARAA